jgi:diketogulonate reductase-like aldo/keto reductase
MPKISLGTWKIPKEKCAQAVFDAIQLGYRGIDCACDYGNEVQVGEGIAKAIAEGICTREELFVTSKLWNTYHAKAHVEPACRKTLTDLGLDYLDLYLIHFPICCKFVPIEERYPPEWCTDAGVLEIVPVPVLETWNAMEALSTGGLTKAIGVSNFSCSLTLDLLASVATGAASIPPAANQVEIHAYNCQDSLVNFMKQNGIAVTAFSPLGSGGYVEIGMDNGDGVGVLANEAVATIAAAHGVSPTQVCLRWHAQRGLTSVPKSSNPAHLKENLDVFGFELSEEEMGTMLGLDRRCRYNDPGQFTKGMGPEWAKNGYPIHN